MNDSMALREMFQHMPWADATVWTAACATSAALDDAPLRELLHHLHLVQHSFLNAWQDKQTEAQPADFADNGSLLRYAVQYHLDAAAYLRTLDGMDLKRPLAVPWTGRFESRLGRKAEIPTLGETMLQVVLHSTYHRGQVNTRLKELGAVPPLTDFIVWIWMGKPHASWPDISG